MILENQNGNKVYSDGSQIETEILNIVQNHNEQEIQELIAKDYNYTINNTFSKVRENILNFYKFKKNSTVVEIGAGMGSLTGLLCDKCSHVTAVEMNNLRADIIRERYKDRDNLEVLTGDVNNISINKKYDYVVFIGVLEYAGIFYSGENPYVEFIKSAKKLLKEDGILLFAIENRFGLKYWLGASEDHIQKPFVGIEGYPEKNTAKTFSKSDLKKILELSELRYNRFYYVFPDYKFPTMIFTDGYIPSHNDFEKISFTYSRNSLLVAKEKKLYKDIIENNVIGFFANSFLVEASSKDLDGEYSLFVSSRSECKKEYNVITTIESDGVVIKSPASNEAIKHVEQTYKNEVYLSERKIDLIKTQYKDGKIISKIYNGIRADKAFENFLQNNDLKSIFHMIDELKDNLLKSSKIVTGKNILDEIDVSLSSKIESTPIMEYGFIDMTFYNAFYDNGNLIFFDQEWFFNNVPLNFILYYATKIAFNRSIANTKITFEQIKSYLNILNSDVYDKLEEYIWSKVLKRSGDLYGGDGYCNQYSDELTLKHKLDNYEKEIQNIKYLKQQEIETVLSQKQQEIETALSQKQLELETVLSQKQLELEKLDSENQLKIKKVIEESEKKIKKIIEENSLLINNLEIELNNKNGHIELLLQSDRELSNIKKRWRWRIVNFPFYATKKIAKALLPKGTKGYLFAKLFMNTVRNPGLYLSKLNFKNIKKLRRMMSNEGTQRTIEKLEQFNEFNTKINEQGKIEVLDIKNIHFNDEIAVPYFSDITVSIIIPVYNQFEYTYNCIKSIVENTTDISYEIIIADDVSSDKTLDINDIVKNIIVIRNEKNLGFLLNCNNASKKARGKYLYFLNNDTNIQKNTIVKLIETFNNFGKVGLVGSKLVYPDGKLQEAGGIFWNDASAWNYGNRAEAEMPEYNYVKEVDYVSGASMMISKDIWKEIGGFDERYVPAYCEDSDLAFEVRRKGYKVMYQPKSVVVHFEGISNGTDTNTGIKAYQLENQKKLFDKWKDVLQKEHYLNGENVFKARDRSFNKKTILVIDHYVPHYDKDAGSRTIYQYLKLFVKMGLNVKFIGDNYFKHEPYTSDLQEMGIEVLYGSYYANNWKEWIKINSKYIDYVFLNRPHITKKYIDFIREHTKARIFYYGHDLHFLREKREYELTQNKELVNDYQKTMNDEFSIMRKSDIVYYPSFVEVEEIKKHDTLINVKAIQAYMYDDIVYSQYILKNRKDLLFVGGFGHKPNVDAILWFTKEVFPKILKNNPEIKLNIVGSNPTQDIKDLKSENINVVGYVSDEELEKYYLETRMVVVPLRYGAGIKGKVVEAMTKGVPIITTSVGVEGLENIENMFFICDNAHDFANSVIKCYYNEEILKSISDKFYDYIRRCFSSEHALNIIKNDFS